MTATLILRVANPEHLRPGCAPTHCFDRAGGTFGAGDMADWRLQDDGGGLIPVHAEIRCQHDRWCLVDRSGRARLNGMETPLPNHRPVGLREGDIIAIGVLALQVRLTSTSIALPGEEDRSVDVLTAVASPSMLEPTLPIMSSDTATTAWRTVYQQLMASSPIPGGDILHLAETSRLDEPGTLWSMTGGMP
jgi:predicted component of type VI protein secretion system